MARIESFEDFDAYIAARAYVKKVHALTRQKPKPRGTQGAAIISVLLVLTVLTIMVVAFLQSMRIDRLTARAYLNKTKAEMLAKAAANSAGKRIRNSDLNCPVTAYENYTLKLLGTPTSTTILTAIQPSTDGSSVASRVYLASTKDDATPPDPASNDTFDINTAFGAYSLGWIGLKKVNASTSAITRKPVPVEWIYATDNDGKVIGRYAFWVDDESARIDMWTAGSVANPTGTPPDLGHSHRAGNSPGEISLHGILTSTAEVQQFLDFRGLFTLRPPGAMTFFQAPIPSFASTENIRSVVGLQGKSDERGSLGKRKINLNTWANTNADHTTPGGRTNLVNKVIALGDYIDDALPDFGKRYHTGAVNNADKRLYCIKIAANIQDYVDQDSQPTVIRNNLGGWQNPPDPTAIGEGAPVLPPAVFGKEVVPAIGEYVGYYYNDSGVLRIDHTFEVWNIHSKPVNLSGLGNVRILMAERNDVTPISSAPDPSLPGEPGNPPLTLTIPSASSIAAGSYTLLTTLPASSAYDSQWVVGTPARIRLSRAEPTYTYGTGGLRMSGDQLATSADVDTEIVVMNEFGYLDIQPRVAQQGSVNLRSSDGVRVIASQSFGNDASSGGNNTNRHYPLDSGDPRSLTEVFSIYSEGGGLPSAIAWRRNTANSQGATLLGGESQGGTYGIIPNNSGAAGDYVPEPTRSLNMNATLDAISIIRDGNMASIGELGLIYDPAISGPKEPAGYPNTTQRAGFRTMAIGSPLGETLGPAPLTQVTAASKVHRLLELFTATNELEGKIHLNSALRDESNLPLRALLDQLHTQSNDTATSDFAGPRDPAFPGSAAAAFTVNTDNVIAALSTRLSSATPGPFLSLGQLGELSIFTSGTQLFAPSSFSMAPNAANNTLLDRGREEIFRNIVERLTLKGSRFRIFAVGQSGEINKNNVFVPYSTARMTRLIEVTHEYPQADPLASLAMPDIRNNNTPTGTNIVPLDERWE